MALDPVPGTADAAVASHRDQPGHQKKPWRLTMEPCLAHAHIFFFCGIRGSLTAGSWL